MPTTTAIAELWKQLSAFARPEVPVEIDARAIVT